MKKLRSSRFAKLISAVLIVLMTFSVIVNIVSTVVLMDENLYYASKTQMQQKLYSYLYEYTASDLLKYLSFAENMHTNNDSYKNYHQSELDLYKTKYSPENSNIYFRITDENGNILLTNGNIVSDDCFIFTSLYTSETSSDYYWYDENLAEKYEYEVIVTSYDITESTTFKEPYSEEVTVFSESEETTEAKITEPVVFEQNTEDYGISLATISDNNYSVEEFTVSNVNSENITQVKYYYSDEINYKILNHCKEAVRNLKYDISDISFRQDDYQVLQDEEFYEGGYDIAYSFAATDENVPERGFTTTLLSEGKTAEISYAYEGSFYIEEFQDRLSAVSLILENSSEENMTFDYHQKSRITLNAYVEVPYAASARDGYFYAEKLVDAAIIYRDNIILFTMADILLLILSFAFLFWSAGYIPEKEKPVARYLHRIPFDVVSLISVILALICLQLVFTGDDVFVIIGITVWTLLVVGLSYSLTVRLRTHTVISSCLFYILFRLIKDTARVLNKNVAAAIKILLIILAFVFCTGAEILIFFFIGCETPDGGIVIAIILLIVRLLEIPVIAYTLVSLTALHSGAKQISKGDVEYRINKTFLIGSMRKHASYLNSINDAVNSAVEERVRSESLKTELITNVSHDLKTPLTSIVNYVDLLKKEEITNEKAVQYIEVIDRQSQRLKKLTVDIVEASKAATGNIEVHKEELILNVFLNQTNGEYIERLSEKSLSLVQDIPVKQIKITADGRLLWRVIDNLMNNIYKYSMPGTRVYLNLSEENGRAYISFRNISKNELNIDPGSLTERFVRGDSSRNTDGSGLGLSIAKSLTEIMGGNIGITIDGDLFKVTLSFPVNS